MKRAIFLIVTVAILGLYLQLVAAHELKYIALGLAILAVIALAAFLFFFCWLIYEKIRLRRAERIEREREAYVKIVTAGNQVFIRDTDHKASWRAAHLDPRFYANGQYSEPTDIEIMAWRAFNAPKVIKEQAALLPATTQQVDLLTVLDNSQCALIVGSQDAGKTTLLKHVITRRLMIRSYVLVLDPHSSPDRWPHGCEVVGTGRRFDLIERALTGLMALMDRRYREIGKGEVAEGGHDRITVILDEWTPIVEQLGRPAAKVIKTLLTESRKTNIDMFVGSHSDRVGPLGIEGAGDLKKGFVMVRLTVNKMTHERRATVDYGDGEIEVTLPGPYRGGASKVVDYPPIDLEPKPTDQEAEILEMLERDESLKTITEAVWGPGKFGKFYNDKVEEIRQKWA